MHWLSGECESCTVLLRSCHLVDDFVTGSGPAGKDRLRREHVRLCVTT